MKFKPTKPKAPRRSVGAAFHSLPVVRRALGLDKDDPELVKPGAPFGAKAPAAKPAEAAKAPAAIASTSTPASTSPPAKAPAPPARPSPDDDDEPPHARGRQGRR